MSTTVSQVPTSRAALRAPARRFLRRLLRSERGAVLVEFGIVVPIFAALMCAIIDFSMAMFTLNNLTIAVREGGRVAAIIPDLATNDARVIASVRERLNMQFGTIGTAFTVTVAREFPTGTNIGRITVRINNFPYVPITPMARVFGMSQINLNRTVVFMSERSNPPV